jgi:hypothetical protein
MLCTGAIIVTTITTSTTTTSKISCMEQFPISYGANHTHTGSLVGDQSLVGADGANRMRQTYPGCSRNCIRVLGTWLRVLLLHSCKSRERRPPPMPNGNLKLDEVTQAYPSPGLFLLRADARSWSTR